jgi:hypothetical protein
MNWRDRPGRRSKLCPLSIELHGLVTTLSDKDKVVAELRLDGALHLCTPQKHTSSRSGSCQSLKRLCSLSSAASILGRGTAATAHLRNRKTAPYGSEGAATLQRGAGKRAYLANRAGGENDIVELLDHLARAKLTERATGLS